MGELGMGWVCCEVTKLVNCEFAHGWKFENILHFNSLKLFWGTNCNLKT